MDRISLTWEAALADPSAAAALLRRLEEQAEAYIVRSRTLRQWLENVPPFSAMGEFLPTTAPDDGHSSADFGDESASGGQPSPEGGDDVPGTGAAHAGPRDGGLDSPEEPTAPTGEHEAGPGEAADGEQDKTSAGFVPPPRQPAGDREATAKARERTGGREQETAPTGEQLTLHERVEAVLERFRPGVPLTVRNIALEIGHSNLRSLRPILDRMTAKGLLMKTELHPRAVVYHRPETAGSPRTEATMF